MPVQNTPNSYGLVARAFHWLTALVILSAIPLGVIANDMAASPETMAAKATLFSLHKTLGVAAFGLGLARIVWALSQPRPAGLHPQRRLESFAAHLVHWLLYLSLAIVPLSGWVHHAAVAGFAPILWPFGQGLPFVPKSDSVATVAGAVHWVFTKVLIASILLHIAGALKHHLIDRDDTLRRMLRGTSAPAMPQPRRSGFAPLALAIAVYGAGVGVALSLAPTSDPAPAFVASPQTVSTGNWQVTEGSLGFSVVQMGAAVEGSFASWTAEITHDDRLTTGQTGTVLVTVDLASLTLGSVTDQAKGPEFLDVASHPKAIFKADLFTGPDGQTAKGSLVLHGVEQPITLPFALTITGDTAQMTGEVTLNRQDFGIGAGYADEETVGFAVTVKVALTAKRR
jgi:cytochrome b561/polyisoprenoid-binding protein YceI